MAKQVNFLEEATTEAHEAWLWYLERSERAGQRFQKAFEAAIEEIKEHPKSWPDYLKGTKYVPVKRFPYLVVYRELEEEIQVIAVAHGHRREGYWKDRV